jgi:hypothetical protein
MSISAISSSAVAPTFPASITSRINYLPSDYPIQWSSDGHGTYSHHARSCWTAYTDWRRSSEAWAASISAANVSVQVARVNTTQTFYISASTTIYPTTSVSTYTLCDGSARAHVSPYTTHYVTTLINLRPSLTTLSPTFAPNPCVPTADDCAVYYFRSNLGYYNSTADIIKWLDQQCGLPVDWPQPCIIQGGPVQLLYFPVPEVSRNICPATSARSFVQYPQNPTTGNAPVITTLGRTFSPGSAYISFETLFAGCRSSNAAGYEAVQVGKTFSNTIFEFRSDEISTNCFATIDPYATTTAGYGLGTQLNFADLNLPVAASAYKCQDQCRSCVPQFINGRLTASCAAVNECATIWDNFSPLLAMPTRLREIVPEWSTCSFWNDRIANVIFDPPSALTAADAAAPASQPSYLMTAMSARPASVSASPTPVALPDNLNTIQSYYVTGGQAISLPPTSTIPTTSPPSRSYQEKSSGSAASTHDDLTTSATPAGARPSAAVTSAFASTQGVVTTSGTHLERGALSIYVMLSVPLLAVLLETLTRVPL